MSERADLVEEVIEAVAIEEPVGEESGSESLSTEVRPVPEPRNGAELDSWRGEVRAIAVVAAGGIAAGAVTVAALSVAKSRTAARPRTHRRLGADRRDGIVASRSFLVDVHVLGR